MASDIHMACGIEGDSRDAGHEGEIEILSAANGIIQPTSSPSSGGSATKEKATFQDMIVTKYTDKASPGLQTALLKGTVIDSVVITFSRPDGQGGKVDYIQYVLNEVNVSSYQLSSSGNGVPLESIGFVFAKYYFVWVPTDPATGAAQGNVESRWDLALNKEA